MVKVVIVESDDVRVPDWVTDRRAPLQPGFKLVYGEGGQAVGQVRDIPHPDPVISFFGVSDAQDQWLRERALDEHGLVDDTSSSTQGVALAYVRDVPSPETVGRFVTLDYDQDQWLRSRATFEGGATEATLDIRGVALSYVGHNPVNPVVPGTVKWSLPDDYPA